MTIDPQLAQLLEQLNDPAAVALRDQDLGAARAQFDVADQFAFPEPDPMAKIEDVMVNGTLRIRRYLPDPNAAGLILFFHGGGFVFGSIESHEGPARHLAALTGIPVASVDYRLAPEHPFPAAVEDAIAALDWAVAEQMAGDGPLAVAGDSAGGGLAAVAAVTARDRGVTLRGQLLCYPATDKDLEAPSVSRFGQGYFLTREDLLWFRAQLAVPEEFAIPWWLCPVAADLHGVAPAIVAVAGYDPIRDWGIRFAEKLDASGVPVALRDYPGMVHGFVSFGHLAPSALAATEELYRGFGNLLATGALPW